MRSLRLAAGVLALVAVNAFAQAPARLEVIVFAGGFNWPIWAAQEKGFFRDSGVEVNLTPTPGSVFQMVNLIDGKFDIAMTAVDNLIAYREGQGEDPKVGPDLVAVMGADQGFLKLVSVPEVTTIGQLRGKTVSVDARTTGYAFVLFELLERGGLREPDFKVDRAGGVLQRFQALMEKKHDATLLLSPFEVQAEARGFHSLASASQALGAYQGLVAAVRESWAREHREALVGYIRAYARGVEWLYDPANKTEAIALLRKNLTTMTPEGAEASYRVLLDRDTGFQRNAAISMEGVARVLALRAKWSEQKKPLGEPSQYYDPAYYDAAMRR
ncbi:MAG TPA: ABC transporter substrate-binding protein [Casimicrobiaceae bacterium]|nr:ABC transporter substrate-binding protein [Casimicrobiaceae bacterium]